jgi:drug/metabolite transporter (DMT)-like permease
VLFALNCLLVLPFSLSVGRWHGSVRVLALHGASIVALLVTSACVFALTARGSATAVALGQAVSPVPALVLAALLLATPIDPVRVGAAGLVTIAVLAPLRHAYGPDRRWQMMALVTVGALSTAVIAVLTKLLLNAGAGLVEIYVIRTAGAAAVALSVFPPRDIPARALPGMLVRAASVTAFYMLSIAALAHGDPAAVQATVATTPLFLAGAAALRARRRPDAALTVAVLAAPVSIVLLASGHT